MQKTNEMGTAVVTGASSGLGSVFAERLAQRGYNLILVARREERLETLAKKLRQQYNVEVENMVADLSVMTDLEKVADTVSKDTKITMLVNNAGTSTLAPFIGTPVQKQLAMINLNITALTLMANAVLPGFKQRDQGTLINIGSAIGLYSLAFTGIYSGTKGYVASFTMGLQEELKDTKVVVQLAAPAAVATEIYDIGGIPLSAFDPALVMTIENCVDAVLSGLDQGEQITFPSVENHDLFKDYDEARLKLFAATQTGQPASRYKLH